MALVKKSITITDRQEQWIRAQIGSGDYGNDKAACLPCRACSREHLLPDIAIFNEKTPVGELGEIFVVRDHHARHVE